MYCGVDVIVRDAIRLAEGRVEEFTIAQPVKKKESQTGAAIASLGCGGLIALFAFGVLAQQNGGFCGGMLLIFAAVLLIPGLALLGKSHERVTGYFGPCPYCGSHVTLPPGQGADCPACNKRIVTRGTKFISVDTPVSGVKRHRE
jgi:DNA-directed RNA polymerase subunit RPC12/RpoP